MPMPDITSLITISAPHAALLHRHFDQYDRRYLRPAKCYKLHTVNDYQWHHSWINHRL